MVGAEHFKSSRRRSECGCFGRLLFGCGGHGGQLHRCRDLKREKVENDCSRTNSETVNMNEKLQPRSKNEFAVPVYLSALKQPT